MITGFRSRQWLDYNGKIFQTDAVKNYLIPACNYREELQWFPYAEEADLLNVALFGFTAKAWREANPELAAQKGLASVSMSMIADKIGIIQGRDRGGDVSVSQAAGKRKNKYKTDGLQYIF